MKEDATHPEYNKPIQSPSFAGDLQVGALTEVPGDYISARDLHSELGIWAATAQAWRNFGKIEAKKIGNTWFYPREDLSKLVEKRNRRMYPITIDGKPTKRQDIRSVVHGAILKEAPGDYISSSDVRNKAGIKDGVLRKWRRTGKARAKKVGRSWYYSRQDLLKLLKTEPTWRPKSK